MPTRSSVPALESWINQASCGLSAASRDQVRKEILEHYESALESLLARGVIPEEAERAAIASLGDSRATNREYRRVLLTKAEARLLREGNWEANAFCSLRLRPWFFLVPGTALGGVMTAFVHGNAYLASMFLLGLAGVLFVFAAPFLPIYTKTRSRVVRYLRLAWLSSVLVLAFWPDILKYSWLLASCAWPLVWIEWMRFSIRRKLPVDRWPKQLYL